MKNKIACLIPARSGSKRIKNKNLLKINKKESLIKFVCKNIVTSKKINNFFIGTDKKKIFNSIGILKKKFIIFNRSKKSASDKAPTELVVKEFLKKNRNFNIIVLVQLTNPFIHSKYIDEAINKFLKNKYDSLLSVTKTKHFLWKFKKFAKPINYDFKRRPRSQKFKSYYIENGSFYIFYKKNFLKFNNRLHGKIGVYEMPAYSSQELDTYDDLLTIKKLLK